MIKSNYKETDLDEPLRFPPLYVYVTNRRIQDPKDLALGASWNIRTYYETIPFYYERSLIFGELFFPYDVNTPHFKSQHKRLPQWDYFNLFAYTDREHPENVYIKEELMKKDSRTIAIFRFLSDRIELFDTLP